MSNKKLTKSESGKLGANETHKERYELLKTVSANVSKTDLNWIQAKWKTKQIKLLVEAWKKSS